MTDTKETPRIDSHALLSGVVESTSREQVECAKCELVHYKDERIEHVGNVWTTYHCPKCKSESTCKV
jgi:predicted Zn-ribbon and HTH transcriptional regulator